MLHDMFALAVHLLVLIVTFLLIGGLPVMLFAQTLEYLHARRNGTVFLAPLSVGAAFLIGGVAGWMLRPPQWPMPFRQTLEAAGNAAKYGHNLESQAERVLMYPWYLAVLCAIVAAAAAGVMFRLRRPIPN
jgi:hypothetical protein